RAGRRIAPSAVRHRVRARHAAVHAYHRANRSSTLMHTRLLHLCDRLFPIGGFAFSDGLEAAAARHLSRDAGELSAWLDTVLDESLGRCEGPAVALAWRAFDAGRWDRL